MQVLALVSRKGGSGKTTLAGHLAVEAVRAGDGPIAVVDTDPQGSLAAWWNARKSTTPAFVQTTLSALPRDLERLERHGVEFVIVDTPSVLTKAIGEVVKAADLVLIPSRPSPHDVRALSATVELVEHLGTPLVFVINAAVPRTRITTETITLISAFGPMVPTTVGHRIDFAASMIDGRTAMELPGRSRSTDEIARLWTHVRGRLTGDMPRRPLPRLRTPASADDPLAVSNVGRA